MSNPFSNKPTIVEEEEQEDETTDEDWGDDVSGPDVSDPQKVKEDYDRVGAQGNEVQDKDDEADEEWAQTPIDLFGEVDQDKFWWVVVTTEEGLAYRGEEVTQRGIPAIQSRHDNYEDYVEARSEFDEDALPEGTHVQLRSSNKVRYVKGEDEAQLLEWRGVA